MLHLRCQCSTLPPLLFTFAAATVQPARPGVFNSADISKKGRLGQRRNMDIFSEEFLKELRGIRGIEVYCEMAEDDDICGAILYSIETLIWQTAWNFTLDLAQNAREEN